MKKSFVALMVLTSFVFAAGNSGGVSDEKVKQEVQMSQDAQKQEIATKKSNLDAKHDVKKEMEKTKKTMKEKEENVKDKVKKEQ